MTPEKEWWHDEKYWEHGTPCLIEDPDWPDIPAIITEAQRRERNKEIIICAAIKLNGKIYRGNRHSDCYRSAINPIGEEEGFITSTGRFVSREEAKKIHEKSGIAPFHGEYEDETRLFSEDLY